MEIPRGIVGRVSSESHSNHGFGALLPTEEGNDYLLVQGDRGAELDNPDDIPGSLNQVVSTRLKWVSKEPAVCLKEEVTETMLGDLMARRIFVKYKCLESGHVFIQDRIIAICEGGALVEVSLYATEQSYEQSRPILEMVAQSWKLERKKCK